MKHCHDDDDDETETGEFGGKFWIYDGADVSEISSGGFIVRRFPRMTHKWFCLGRDLCYLQFDVVRHMCLVYVYCILN